METPLNLRSIVLFIETYLHQVYQGSSHKVYGSHGYKESIYRSCEEDYEKNVRRKDELTLHLSEAIPPSDHGYTKQSKA